MIITLIFLIVILILVNKYLFRSMKGDIDFSLKETRINLIKGIIWVLLLWFLIPSIMQFEQDYANSDDSGKYLLVRISVSILFAIPVWRYWVIKPLYNWIKRGKDS